MRYYDISITDEANNIVSIDGVDLHFTSYRNGVNSPGALNVEFDIPVVNMSTPAPGNAYLKIWGIDLNTLNKISSISYQTFKNITILAGMQSGLPLAKLQAEAKPARNSVIFQGSVLQAFGNWQGTEQTVDFILSPTLAARSTDTPKISNPLKFNCNPGQTFESALAQSMLDGGITSSIAIDSRLVPSSRVTFVSDNVGRFAQNVLEQSKNIIKDANYIGVQMFKTAQGYDFSDGSLVSQGIIVDFKDLIGQPTWLDFSTLQLKTVLRSDIKVGDTIILPDANIIEGRFFNPKNSIAYTGTANVIQVRHIGNFRQPDANSWVTVLNVLPNRS